MTNYEQDSKVVGLVDELTIMVLTPENQIQILMCTYEETNGQLSIKFRKISEIKSITNPEDIQDFSFDIDESLDKMTKEEMIELCRQSPIIENSMEEINDYNRRLLSFDIFCADTWKLTEKMINAQNEIKQKSTPL